VAPQAAFSVTRLQQVLARCWARLMQRAGLQRVQQLQVQRRARQRV
jgi:hypothetical protein